MQKPQTRHSFGPHEKAGNCVDKRRPFHGSFVAIPRSPLCSALAGRGLRVCSDMIDRSRCACCEGVLDNVCSSVPGWRTMAAVGGLGSSARFGSSRVTQSCQVGAENPDLDATAVQALRWDRTANHPCLHMSGLSKCARCSRSRTSSAGDCSTHTASKISWLKLEAAS